MLRQRLAKIAHFIDGSLWKFGPENFSTSLDG
jgi:hypothetical protein